MSATQPGGGRPEPAPGSAGLDRFYRGLVTRLRRRRVPCAITGGLACVEFGVVEHTEDCDLLCRPAGAEALFSILVTSEFRGGCCRYRSALSAPLDRRWLGGGWTSHFTWGTGRGECPYLDVFGVPPRVTGPWERRYRGPFADRATVAEMKRTRRRKDWDQATALGLQMLKRGDEAGWLHLFDADVLAELAARLPRPRRLLGVRPVLGLAFEKDPLLSRAVQTEVEFWSKLDAERLRVFEAAGRPYAVAVLRRRKSGQRPLVEEHAERVMLAERLLPVDPLREHGIERLVASARGATMLGLDPCLGELLPDVRLHFAPWTA